MTPRSAVVRAVLLAVLAISPAAAVASPDAATITQHEIALLQFYGGGSPLSAQERQQAADMVQQELHEAPGAETTADAGATKLLHMLTRADGPLIALARETGRLNAQLHAVVDPALRQQQVMEARIIAAHDPVIVFDATHKRLITEQTVRVLQRADAVGASTFDVPPPGPDFVAQMREALPRAYPTMDDGMQNALAHAERDLPYAPGFLRNMNPQKRAAIVQTYRAKIMAAPDTAGQQLNLAEVMAVVGATASRRGSGSGGTQGALADRLQRQNLLNHQLEGAMRSYSPTCNITRPDAMANFSSCHP
jgi:hypothetical protein